MSQFRFSLPSAVIGAVIGTASAWFAFAVVDGASVSKPSITISPAAWQATDQADPTADNKTSRQSRDPQQQANGGFPDLIAGLKETEGCLGVDAGQMQSGKNAIFAWFEDKDALLRWYHSPMHRQVMGMLGGQPKEDPMPTIPDDAGPIMVIASITFSDEPMFENSPIPFSQIAIELYAPLKEGLDVGGRFSPNEMKIGTLKQYPSIDNDTDTETNENPDRRENETRRE